MTLRGRQHPIELLSTSDSDNRNQLLCGGGKGQVPCMRIELDDGNIQWMYESDDILNYVRDQGLIN